MLPSTHVRRSARQVSGQATATEAGRSRSFDRNEDGELASAHEPSQEQNEERAVRLARRLAVEHIGVTAWSQEATTEADDLRGDFKDGRPARSARCGVFRDHVISPRAARCLMEPQG